VLSQITSDASTQFLLAALIGLIAGILGGLAGIGGSMIMIPGLALVFGYDDPQHSEQHVYMAAAMTINVLVSLPAAWRHHRNKALRRELVVGILPAMIGGIVIGVLVSNVFEGHLLRLLLAAFIAVFAIFNIYRAIRPRNEATRPPERIGRPMLVGVGSLAGFIGGLLGLGGGVVMVPLLQLLSNVRLRHAIAASAAVMVISATIGALIKLVTLDAHNRDISEAMFFVIALAPGAVLGGIIGAQLAHMLPLRVVRVAVSVLLLLIAARLGGVFGGDDSDAPPRARPATVQPQDP
jgi:uncharacterized protein